MAQYYSENYYGSHRNKITWEAAEIKFPVYCPIDFLKSLTYVKFTTVHVRGGPYSLDGTMYTCINNSHEHEETDMELFFAWPMPSHIHIIFDDDVKN